MSQSQIDKTIAHNMKSITEAVAAQFDLDPLWLRQASNRYAISRPRGLAMMLIRDLVKPTPSYPEIGRWFGSMHHTTVIHAVREARKRVETDEIWLARACAVQRQAVLEPIDRVLRQIAAARQHVTKSMDTAAEAMEQLSALEAREHERLARVIGEIGVDGTA